MLDFVSTQAKLCACHGRYGKSACFRGQTQSPDCFTDGQIQTLEILDSEQNIKGQKVFPGWPVGAEAEGLTAPAPGVMATEHIGWYGYLVQNDQRPNCKQFSEAFFRYLTAPEKKPIRELSDLDFEVNPPRPDWIRETRNATDTDLPAFRDSSE